MFQVYIFNKEKQHFCVFHSRSRSFHEMTCFQILLRSWALDDKVSSYLQTAHTNLIAEELRHILPAERLKISEMWTQSREVIFSGDVLAVVDVILA